MNLRLAALSVLLLVSAAAGKVTNENAALEADDESVVDLSGGNFDAEFRAGLPHAYVVEFYNPSCKHCIEFAPVYAKVAKHYASDAGITVARVDGTQNRNLLTQFGVNSYPTVKFFPSKYKASTGFLGATYPRDRTEAALEDWIQHVRTMSVEQLQHSSAQFKSMRGAPALSCPVGHA